MGDARLAKMQAEAARALAVSGRCREAIGRFAHAYMDLGAAHHGSPGRGTAENALSRAQTAINNFCVCPAHAGVSGTVRRRRRRRR